MEHIKSAFGATCLVSVFIVGQWLYVPPPRPEVPCLSVAELRRAFETLAGQEVEVTGVVVSVIRQSNGVRVGLASSTRDAEAVGCLLISRETTPDVGQKVRLRGEVRSGGGLARAEVVRRLGRE